MRLVIDKEFTAGEIYGEFDREDWDEALRYIIDNESDSEVAYFLQELNSWQDGENEKY